MKLHLLALGLAALPALAGDAPMPPLTGLDHWINADAPLTRENLRGKVVLVDFWAYSCVNCLRAMPHVKNWHARYKDKGFTVLGVHTPEFDFEKDPANVQRAAARLKILHPVAQDDDFTVWNAFKNRHWPSHYLVDKSGVIRYSHAGEGNYAETEARIRALLAETGPAPDSMPTADLSGVKTPEIYLGHRRLKKLSNKERPLPDRPRDYRPPEKLSPDAPALEGRWTIEPESARLEGTRGRVILSFEASAVHMVLSSEIPSEAEIRLDGRPLDEQTRGADAVAPGGRSLVRIHEARLYSLAKAGPGRHTLEIIFTAPGIRAFTFTFG